MGNPATNADYSGKTETDAAKTGEVAAASEQPEVDMTQATGE